MRIREMQLLMINDHSETECVRCGAGSCLKVWMGMTSGRLEALDGPLVSVMKEP